MATSLIGPFLTLRASAAAPVPRPPQPTRATRIVLSSAAWTHGAVAETIVVAAANRPVCLKNSRRVVSSANGWFMDHLYRKSGLFSRQVSVGASAQAASSRASHSAQMRPCLQSLPLLALRIERPMLI